MLAFARPESHDSHETDPASVAIVRYRGSRMIYSAEVEHMTACQGTQSRSAPIPEEGRWVQAKEIKDIAGLTTSGLVRASAGRLQADAQREGWRHPGSPD